MNLTFEQLHTLRHMLGINDPTKSAPEPYRNYYCAVPGDDEMEKLRALGMVRIYSSHDGYEWFECTDKGAALAKASYKDIRYSKAKRRYCKWLSVSDAMPDLTFGQFLTDPEFEQMRREA